MATKRETASSQLSPDCLIINKQDFKNQINDRITIGEELFSRQVTSNDGYDRLKNDVDIWSDYNFELLKQVFNNQTNNYMQSYIDAGYTFLGQMGVIENNPVQTKKNLIAYKLNNLKSLLAKADLLRSDISDNSSITTNSKNISINKSEVFIVHGHDELAKTKTARFIERLGLRPIILHEQTSSGKTIIEKIEEYTNVGFGIVLYTPCDVGCKKGNEENLQNRARQNVVFEHGYLIGKIGRNNVCALVKGTIEVPNDISGVVYIKMDEDESWHIKIAKELRSSGYEIDMNKL
jgi:predicted nucleotide-binding protein